MRLMPKRVKFRKSQRGKIKGNATRGNAVSFGEFGLQALELDGSRLNKLKQEEFLQHIVCQKKASLR